jgi:hypothetical protein
MVFVENLGRHAIGAPQIATVGERNPQITHRAPELVEWRGGGGIEGHWIGKPENISSTRVLGNDLFSSLISPISPCGQSAKKPNTSHG